MSLEKLGHGALSTIVSGPGTKLGRSSRPEGEFWMRSVRGTEVLSGGHLSRSVDTQWALRSASSAFVSCGGCPTTAQGDTRERRGGNNLRWNGDLRPSFEPRRSGGSSRARTVRVRVAGGGWALPSLDYNSMYQVREKAVLTSEGPSCIFVGPLETAEKARLEALYQQVRKFDALDCSGLSFVLSSSIFLHCLLWCPR